MGIVIDFNQARAARRLAALPAPVQELVQAITANVAEVVSQAAPEPKRPRPAVVYNDFTGNKYEATKHLKVHQLAPLIRKDIKAAMKAGEIPEGIYKVTTNRDTIKIIVSAVALQVIDEHQYRRSLAGEWVCDLTQDAKDLRRALERIINHYGYDYGNLDTDYWNQRFYAYGEFDSNLLKIERAQVAERIANR